MIDEYKIGVTKGTIQNMMNGHDKDFIDKIIKQDEETVNKIKAATKAMLVIDMQVINEVINDPVLSTQIDARLKLKLSKVDK